MQPQTKQQRGQCGRGKESNYKKTIVATYYTVY